MKFRDEYRDRRSRAQRLPTRSPARATRPWTLMEVCGGQTHAIVRYGIDELLPPGIKLVHGPGCPVCVTPVDYDRQGDRDRRPAGRDLLLVRRHAPRARAPAATCSPRSRAAPTSASSIRRSMRSRSRARARPRGRVLRRRLRDHGARQRHGRLSGDAARGSRNFSMLVSHVLVPPAMRAILCAAGNRVQGFLAAGHVCTDHGLSRNTSRSRADTACRSS